MAAADELDGMSSEESDHFVSRLIAEAEADFPPERLSRLDENLQELGISTWVQRYVLDKDFNIRNFLLAKGVMLPYDFIRHNISHLRMVAVLKTVLMRLLRHRERLTQFNTPDDAVNLIRNANNIIVLTGAGISVSCGIPDFRSRDGIYATLERTYDLDKPEDMFDKEYFMTNPSVFFDFAHSIFPSNFKPSASHRFVKLLQDKGKLLRNYTQNIDTLEQAAGITRVLQCHGSFATATCTTPICQKHVDGSEIKEAIFAQRVPMCPDCAARHEQADNRRRKKARVGPSSAPIWTAPRLEDDEEEDDLPGMGVLKPDITFFGEKLSRHFDQLLEEDRPVADLIIVAGTSLKVAPVAELLTFMPHRVPVIVINKTPILHFQTDIMLLGSSDSICAWLAQKLGWDLPAPEPSEKAIGRTSAAEREVDVLQESSSLPAAEVEREVPELPPVVEPVKWDGADYIWGWPDADLGMLEVMRARQMTTPLESEAEDAEEEEGAGSGSEQDGDEDGVSPDNDTDTGSATADAANDDKPDEHNGQEVVLGTAVKDDPLGRSEDRSE